MPKIKSYAKKVQTASATLFLGDCQDVVSGFPPTNIDLLVVDPPYMGVKDRKSCPWDHQWEDAEEYVSWIGNLCVQWRRMLRANGSVYIFASPRMAARVEVEIGKVFHVLNRITWRKEEGWVKRQCKEEQRAYFPASEAIVFAEVVGADGIVMGEMGYDSKCDELRGFVFESPRLYLCQERDRAGFTTRQVAKAYQKKTGSRTVTGMAGHWFDRVQWESPTEENYLWLRTLLNGGGSSEYLRREYEYLRRPFSVTADVPYTDVWDFPTVNAYAGKHPCEKPLAMLEHIVRASSRPGNMVLDPCMGSGTTGVAAVKLGRKFIGVEIDPSYFETACRRIAAADPVFEQKWLF